MADPLTLLAQRVATRAHAGQLYGEQPYAVHLQAVVNVLDRFGVRSSPILAAGWLHDVLEDTEMRVDELKRSLESQPSVNVDAVIAIVDACTDGVGGNRRERKERPFRLIPETPDAILVKLADRIANAEASSADGNARLLKMYRGEHDAFKARLSGHGGPVAVSMWAHLESVLPGE